MAPIHEFEDADFLVRSWLDGATFAVNRAKLESGSHVFRDMFSCCDAPTGDANTQVLDLHETESSLSALLRLLHSPPAPPVQYLPEPIAAKVNTHLPIRYDLATAIPLPVLRLLFCLADKYVLEPAVLESLGAHLSAHAPEDALTVYGMSLSLGDMPYVVSESSQYILPLAWYSADEIKAIPTVADYHNVHRLQTFRVKALQEILLRKDSELFPHGYGMCATHKTSAASAWDRTRLILARKIETNTDVAGEMESLVYLFQSCSTCCKAFTAAVQMLAYKCRRVPRRLDQLPSDF
ncbi:hypothetical protein DFH09DRAFT_305292 [Mycena vulgaris]|nr:hypothetical protein DFH09DRAFT_305292 [Mycena vulgaris]